MRSRSGGSSDEMFHTAAAWQHSQQAPAPAEHIHQQPAKTWISFQQRGSDRIFTKRTYPVPPDMTFFSEQQKLRTM